MRRNRGPEVSQLLLANEQETWRSRASILSVILMESKKQPRFPLQGSRQCALNPTHVFWMWKLDRRCSWERLWLLESENMAWTRVLILVNPCMCSGSNNSVQGHYENLLIMKTPGKKPAIYIEFTRFSFYFLWCCYFLQMRSVFQNTAMNVFNSWKCWQAGTLLYALRYN